MKETGLIVVVPVVAVLRSVPELLNVPPPPPGVASFCASNSPELLNAPLLKEMGPSPQYKT